jgi:dUTPase
MVTKQIRELQTTHSLLSQLLATYDKVMVLKVFVDSEDDELQNTYLNSAFNHNAKILQKKECIDAGFDLFSPLSEDANNVNDPNNRIHFVVNETNPVHKHDLKVICSAKMHTDTGKSYNTGYYLHPRSSISKTPLRLANATGIVDAGYRGHVIAMMDVLNCEYYGNKMDRYVQICAPGLVPIVVEIVYSINELGEETDRGSGGFGSTGR